MPSGLRFCRNCGYRLGEGLAEYTETVRFQNGHNGAGVRTATAPTPNYQTNYGLGGGPIATPGWREMRGLRKRCRRMSGMTWMFLALIIFFFVAGGFTRFRPFRAGFNRGAPATAVSRSFAGVNSFDTTDRGVTFDNVEPAGSPADKAGLVGGDIITTFDGHEIKSDDQMMELLGATPIGKTVDVVYIRDGETRTTKLTTISKGDFDRLAAAFRNRPEGRGRFGYETDDAEKAAVPGMNMFGVRLGKLSQSLPADIAGVKDGDIVVEFDDGDLKVPIRTPEEFEARVQRALPYSTIKVVVMRGSERLEIPVKMGRQ